MLRLCRIAAVLCSLAGSLVAEDTKPDADRVARIAWLKEHAMAVRSIEPGDEDFSDLEPLRQVIGDARIVQLGEQSHGDGATFHAKARLIKFLHQKMGFDVLAMESGLYDCRKAWQALREGREAKAAVSQGVFGIWMYSEQFRPVVDYLGTAAKTERPLELCGFDCQFTAAASQSSLAADLKRVVDRLGSADKDAAAADALIEAVKAMASFQKPADEAAQVTRKGAIETFRRMLEAAQPTDELPADELAFWRQYARSLSAEADHQWAARERTLEAAKQSGAIRDAQMARNLVWLGRESYPERKIIVWAASYHLMRNPSSVTPVNQPADFYRGAVTMGDEVWKELGKATYTLAFVAADGKTGLRGMVPRKLTPPESGSLEDLLSAAGLQNAIVDLRGLDEGGAWLRQELVAKPLGYMPMKADWPAIFDGLMFTRTMYPSTLVTEAKTAQRMPVGWGGSRAGAGSHEAGIETEIRHGGQRSAYLKSTTESAGGFGSLTQVIAATEFRGKRLRYSGFVKSENVEGDAGLWMRVDTAETTSVAFDNMFNRPIKGTADWTKYAVVLSIPEEATDIAFGMLLRGKGRVWLDDARFEIVDGDIATTAMPAPTQKRQGKVVANPIKQPRNLDFEQ